MPTRWPPPRPPVSILSKFPPTPRRRSSSCSTIGKYKYQEQKKQAEARKKQKVVEVKEIKFRPMIDDHDYDVKMRSMTRFFEEGDKVKVTLRFRGREMAHMELGNQLLDRIKEIPRKSPRWSQEARFEGRQMVMILAPR